MKKVFTTNKNSNGLKESLASILECPVNDLPDVSGGPEWIEKLNDFLVSKKGIWIITMEIENPEKYLHGFHLIIGERLLTDQPHVQVGFNGSCVHDPLAGLWTYPLEYKYFGIIANHIK
jgi:hypothetical protein